MTDDNVSPMREQIGTNKKAFLAGLVSLCSLASSQLTPEQVADVWARHHASRKPSPTEHA